eukprot:71817-Chlamydomonas_euryale.AAC.1
MDWSGLVERWLDRMDWTVGGEVVGWKRVRLGWIERGNAGRSACLRSLPTSSLPFLSHSC